MPNVLNALLWWIEKRVTEKTFRRPSAWVESFKGERPYPQANMAQSGSRIPQQKLTFSPLGDNLREVETMIEIASLNLNCYSVTQFCLTLCDPMDCCTQASLFFTISWSLLNLMSIESVMPSNHLILCHPLWRGCLQWGCRRLPSIVPSIRVFSNESVLCIRWPKYWSFCFSTSPSNEYSGLISFRMDWLDLFAVQGTLKSLLQHRSSKTSILQCSAFFIAQLLHP